MKARIELISQGRPRAAPSSHLLAIMKNTPSRKQLRTEQKAARKQPCAQRLPADVSRLVPNNSYGAACKQFYEPVPFRCMDCGKEEIWTARQQKWWYEDCQGSIYSTATRCLPCRIARRQKLAEQRQRTQDGLARKAARTFDVQAFKQEKQRRAQLRRQWRASQYISRKPI